MNAHMRPLDLRDMFRQILSYPGHCHLHMSPCMLTEMSLFYAQVRTFSPSAPKADFDDEKTAEIENGFVGIMYTFNPALDVEHWNTYAVGMQTDGQEWVCVVKNQPNLNGNQEIYLAATPTDKGRPLRELRIEWSDFTATLVGKTKKIPVTVDTSRLETIGFSLRAKPGPFKLKLGWIHARDPLQEDDETEALVRYVVAFIMVIPHVCTCTLFSYVISVSLGCSCLICGVVYVVT